MTYVPEYTRVKRHLKKSIMPIHRVSSPEIVETIFLGLASSRAKTSRHVTVKSALLSNWPIMTEFKEKRRDSPWYLNRSRPLKDGAKRDCNIA